MAAPAAAAPRISYFQGLDAIPKTDGYTERMQAANNTFSTEYKDSFSQLGPEMDALTVTWTASQARATEEDLTRWIVQVVKYQGLRIQAKEALEKIRAAYETAIKYCQLPSLDSNTLATLKKMNANVQQLESQYIAIFTTQLDACKARLTEVVKLSTTIETAYGNMKAALEPTAYRLKAGTFGSLSYLAGKKTPYVDALRDAHKQQVAANKPSEEKDKT